MPIFLAVRPILRAISPRFAIRSFFIMSPRLSQGAPEGKGKGRGRGKFWWLSRRHARVLDVVASVENTEGEIPGGTVVLGRYQILGKLAQGGMAEVYLARQVGPG